MGVSALYRWLVLVWRLPTGVSTPRVTTWRRLRRLGAIPLTPGAAAIGYSEERHEQLDWIAEDIVDWDGDAWVFPLGELSHDDEARIKWLATRRPAVAGSLTRPGRTRRRTQSR